MWDVFISHASQDKESVARPLADQLRDRGFQVWLDDNELRIGDSLRRSIETGLARSRFGIVVLSPSFFGKEWTQRELDGLTAREVAGVKVILPVWHEVDRDDVVRFSPVLADRVAGRTSQGVEAVAAAIGRPAAPATRQAFLMHVGSPGNIDIGYTVTRKRRIREIVKALPENSPERHYFENDVAFNDAFRSGAFNCWGVPHGAEPSFRRTGVGDLVLIVPSITEAGAGVRQIGVVKAACPERCFQASRVLWPNTPDQRLFPWIFFFDTEIGHRSWPDFLEDAGYKENWDPRGWYRRIRTDRFARFGGPQGYLRFLRQDCGFSPLADHS